MTYEYQCTACGHEWEAEQRISAKPLDECPSCHQKTAKRLVTGGAGFILKGGGWYADGYSSGGKGGGGGSLSTPDKGDKGEKSASSSKSSDTTATPSDGKAADKPKPAASAAA